MVNNWGTIRITFVGQISYPPLKIIWTLSAEWYYIFNSHSIILSSQTFVLYVKFSLPILILHRLRVYICTHGIMGNADRCGNNVLITQPNSTTTNWNWRRQHQHSLNNSCFIFLVWDIFTGFRITTKGMEFYASWRHNCWDMAQNITIQLWQIPQEN